MLEPVFALVIWTLVIWIWMYAVRIPAMNKAGIDAEAAKHPGSLDKLPSKARAIGDNYNHLHEQPTIFYALAIYSYVNGMEHWGLAVGLAWAYVGLRVAHSLVQNTVNKVMVRFGVFAASTLVLIALALVNGYKLVAY